MLAGLWAGVQPMRTGGSTSRRRRARAGASWGCLRKLRSWRKVTGSGKTRTGWGGGDRGGPGRVDLRGGERGRKSEFGREGEEGGRGGVLCGGVYCLGFAHGGSGGWTVCRGSAQCLAPWIMDEMRTRPLNQLPGREVKVKVPDPESCPQIYMAGKIVGEHAARPSKGRNGTNCYVRRNDQKTTELHCGFYTEGVSGLHAAVILVGEYLGDGEAKCWALKLDDCGMMEDSKSTSGSDEDKRKTRTNTCWRAWSGEEATVASISENNSQIERLAPAMVLNWNGQNQDFDGIFGIEAKNHRISCKMDVKGLEDRELERSISKTDPAKLGCNLDQGRRSGIMSGLQIHQPQALDLHRLVTGAMGAGGGEVRAQINVVKSEPLQMMGAALE
ncbi:hypothetical protein DFH09DRAFT_1409989 [Mycena vulgaris]|nr:hypothetical protein DFH09DRAFT_1409989 [Mycena vulgaris]